MTGLLSVRGLRAEFSALDCALGDSVLIAGRVRGEVIEFHEDRRVACLFDSPRGLKPGDSVTTHGPLSVRLAPLGQVVDALGRPWNGQVESGEFWPVHSEAPLSLLRPQPEAILQTGIRVHDSLLTLARGQRMAWLSQPGCGAATLRGMLGREHGADLAIFCLLGDEIGALQDWLQRDLGDEGLKRCLVVGATADQTATARGQAPWTALALAEGYARQGQHVVLILDSLDAWESCQGELATPGTLAAWLARTGCLEVGSITALVAAKFHTERWADDAAAARLCKLVEGQLVLTRQMAWRNHYPAVDLTQSVSRRFCQVASREHQQCTKAIRQVVVRHETHITDPGYPEVQAFLRQGVYESAPLADTLERLKRLAQSVTSVAGPVGPGS